MGITPSGRPQTVTAISRPGSQQPSVPFGVGMSMLDRRLARALGAIGLKPDRLVLSKDGRIARVAYKPMSDTFRVDRKTGRVTVNPITSQGIQQIQQSLAITGRFPSGLTTAQKREYSENFGLSPGHSISQQNRGGARQLSSIGPQTKRAFNAGLNRALAGKRLNARQKLAVGAAWNQAQAHKGSRNALTQIIHGGRTNARYSTKQQKALQQTLANAGRGAARVASGASRVTRNARGRVVIKRVGIRFRPKAIAKRQAQRQNWKPRAASKSAPVRKPPARPVWRRR